MRVRSALTVASTLLLVGQSAQWGQKNNPPAPVTIPSGPSFNQPPSHWGIDAPADDLTARARLDKGRQSERQRKMIADTERLVLLAAQLKADMDKADMDKAGKQSPPIEVIRKADEIEKLARSVKDRMKG